MKKIGAILTQVQWTKYFIYLSLIFCDLGVVAPWTKYKLSVGTNIQHKLLVSYLQG